MEYQLVSTGGSDQQIKAYSRLLSDVFPGTNKFTSHFLKWQYKLNPMGTVQGMDAFYGDILAAHYVTLPVVYNIHGKATRGLLSLNTATHPKHQGKGLFTQLATKTYEEGRKAGYEFVIGVANQNSTPGFLKKLGFTLVSPLDVKIGMGYIEFNRNINYTVQSVWSPETLKWRTGNPVATYFANNNTIVAGTGKFGILAQLYSNNQNPKGNLSLKQKSSVAKLWMGMAQDKKQKGLFVDLPQRFRPSPLNLIFKDLSGNIGPFKKEEIFFELIDFDAY